MDNSGFIQMFICNLSVPTQTSIVSIRFTISFVEIDNRITFNTVIHKDHRENSWGSKGSDRMSTNKLINLDSCNIELVMELAEIYDTNQIE